MFIILRKELLSFTKDRKAVMLAFLLPIALITVFALAFGGMGGGSDVQKISLLVCDEDKTDLSKKTIAEVDSVKMLNVILTTNDSALDLIRKGKNSAALVIHKGFKDSANAMKPLPWELEYDAAQTQELGMLQQLLARSLYGNVEKIMTEKMIQANMNKQFSGMDSATRAVMYTQVKNNLESGNSGVNTMQKNTMTLKITSVVKESEDNPAIVQAVAGTAVMMLLFSLTAMGGRLLEEKENGTLKRLLYSPLNPSDILAGKMLSSIAIAFCQLMVMFIYASIVFGLHLAPKLLPVIILVLATAFACSGFGIFLASVVKSRDQLQGLSTLVILVMSAIGGSMVPTFLMPQWMQNIGALSINYWSIQGFYDIFWRQLPIGVTFLSKVGILVGIGSVLSFFSFRLFIKNVLSMV